MSVVPPQPLRQLPCPTEARWTATLLAMESGDAVRWRLSAASVAAGVESHSRGAAELRIKGMKIGIRVPGAILAGAVDGSPVVASQLGIAAVASPDHFWQGPTQPTPNVRVELTPCLLQYHEEQSRQVVLRTRRGNGKQLVSSDESVNLMWPKKKHMSFTVRKLRS